MKKLTIFLILCICCMVVADMDAKPKKRKSRKRVRTTRVVTRPTIHENPYICCEDTCDHIHGIDMSHYQGEVFWETVGENSKMAAGGPQEFLRALMWRSQGGVHFNLQAGGRGQ